MQGDLSSNILDDTPWMIFCDSNEFSGAQDKFANNQENSTRFNQIYNKLNKNNFSYWPPRATLHMVEQLNER